MADTIHTTETYTEHNMRLKLESREVINLINDWARKQYKTKNVSSTFDISQVPNEIFVDIEITLSDIDMDTAHAERMDGLAEMLIKASNKVKEPLTDMPRDIEIQPLFDGSEAPI